MHDITSILLKALLKFSELTSVEPVEKENEGLQVTLIYQHVPGRVCIYAYITAVKTYFQ